MIDEESFKNAMRRLAAGVSIITAVKDIERYGILVTSVISVSAAPPSLLISINQKSSVHDPINDTDCFCVSLLDQSQFEIARHFSSTKPRDRRFEIGRWTTLSTGAPALDGALVSLDCHVAAKFPMHSHTLFVGEIVEAKHWVDAIHPLVYLNGQFLEQQFS